MGRCSEWTTQVSLHVQGHTYRQAASFMAPYTVMPRSSHNRLSSSLSGTTWRSYFLDLVQQVKHTDNAVSGTYRKSEEYLPRLNRTTFLNSDMVGPAWNVIVTRKCRNQKSGLDWSGLMIMDYQEKHTSLVRSMSEVNTMVSSRFALALCRGQDLPLPLSKGLSARGLLKCGILNRKSLCGSLWWGWMCINAFIQCGLHESNCRDWCWVEPMTWQQTWRVSSTVHVCW